MPLVCAPSRKINLTLHRNQEVDQKEVQMMPKNDVTRKRWIGGVQGEIISPSLPSLNGIPPNPSFMYNYEALEMHYIFYLKNLVKKY